MPQAAQLVQSKEAIDNMAEIERSITKQLNGRIDEPI